MKCKNPTCDNEAEPDDQYCLGCRELAEEEWLEHCLEDESGEMD